LLDEPTSALDPKIQKQLMEYTVRIITENNITTLMVTHNLEDAIRYGNRLIMLHDGQIVLELDSVKKRSLNTAQLLELFHSYEDSTLRGN
jgi:putative ABC transport system ATP-binding protein